jgi:glycerol-3-phosphate dehydrogenase
MKLASLQALGVEPLDILVIGGGITGAGVARDAAHRGFRTALIERSDFASGTSSRSSRLIHGGVRYLEHGWFHLVLEASRERRVLLRIAPHLVHPLSFTWPVYSGDRLPRWKLGVGLALYDLLAMYRNVGRHRRWNAREVLAHEPALQSAGLRGGAQYWDAITDDARLTLVNALDAERAGAVIVNHARVRALTLTGSRVDGVVASDEITGEEIRVRARVVVNATGPWSDAIRHWENPAAAAAVHGSKGTHILLPRDRVRNAAAVTLLHPADQRVMFVIPAGVNALIGTTDTRTSSTPDDVRASEQDVLYLLAGANHVFPDAQLTPDDVISAWAGIRPLIATSRQASPVAQSREHAIDVGPGGVIGVSGGKLTTYRVMSEQIVDVAARELSAGSRKCTTDSTPLPGGEAEVDVAAVQSTCGDAEVGEHLVRFYGTAWRDVWTLGESDPTLITRVAPGHPTIGAQLVHAVQHEHARTLGDLLIRRTHLAFEMRDHARSLAERVSDLVAPWLGWDVEQRAHAVRAYETEVRQMFEVEMQDA